MNGGLFVLQGRGEDEGVDPGKLKRTQKKRMPTVTMLVTELLNSRTWCAVPRSLRLRLIHMFRRSSS